MLRPGIRVGRQDQGTVRVRVNLIRLPGYGDCVNQLLGGQVEAVTTDNTILAGFAAQSQNQGKLKVVGTFFRTRSTE